MRLSRSSSVRLLALFLLVTGLAGAQTVDFSKGISHVPNPLGPYIPRKVQEPVFTNAPRIDQLVTNGQLMLSLNDAIALALENNLDLAIARYNLSIADTDILRAKAGATIRGVSTGVVQGTPGGGVGGFGSGASGAGAGGTSTGAGGAGTGAAGQVLTTTGVGANVPSFDPIITSTLSIEHQTSPLPNSITTGINRLQQNFGTANFNYFQGFATGTTMNLAFNNQRVATNSLFSVINPDVSSNFRLTVSQPLLSGFGFLPNMRFIRIAKNNREISDIAFRQQVITTVTQIQNIYWDLVNAYEDTRAKERSLALAQKTLGDNKKQVEIGTLAPIEITRAESEVSTREGDLIVSQTTLQLQQLLIKNAVSRNLSDPALAAAPVIPTDTMTLPAQEPVIPVQDLISDALGHRPELAQSRIDLTNRTINRKSAANALLPSVNLVGFYGNSGLAGHTNPNCAPAGSPECTPPPDFVGGWSSAVGSIFYHTYPDYGVGVTVNIPIKNRAAQADQVRSELEYRQAQMRLQQLQNQIVIEVRNAQFSVQQNRARAAAAQEARRLAQESLEAEQKKYALGASTNTLVLQAQRDLATAESNLVTAMSAYEKARVELDRSVGRTLEAMAISMDDAESGNVKQMPAVKGITPRTDLSTQPMPAQPQGPPVQYQPDQPAPQQNPEPK
ncbi:MAG TPA: TolC family protein [Terriglobales bacterium]|nr:TolC family protein [Terriglobales bacterium]